mmetsp:Transcript_80426/g.160541  ORF Transcript_80426/g.160541 Transcript_80426/m.160541 type:complete len:89 (+) Transcript_80426:310-576(+)
MTECYFFFCLPQLTSDSEAFANSISALKQGINQKAEDMHKKIFIDGKGESDSDDNSSSNDDEHEEGGECSQSDTAGNDSNSETDEVEG